MQYGFACLCAAWCCGALGAAPVPAEKPPTRSHVTESQTALAREIRELQLTLPELVGVVQVLGKAPDPQFTARVDDILSKLERIATDREAKARKLAAAWERALGAEAAKDDDLAKAQRALIETLAATAARTAASRKALTDGKHDSVITELRTIMEWIQRSEPVNRLAPPPPPRVEERIEGP